MLDKYNLEKNTSFQNRNNLKRETNTTPETGTKKQTAPSKQANQKRHQPQKVSRQGRTQQAKKKLPTPNAFEFENVSDGRIQPCRKPIRTIQLDINHNDAGSAKQAAARGQRAPSRHQSFEPDTHLTPLNPTPDSLPISPPPVLRQLPPPGNLRQKNTHTPNNLRLVVSLTPPTSDFRPRFLLQLRCAAAPKQKL